MHRLCLRPAIAALLLAVAATAGGHSKGTATVPADGATLESPPQTIRVRFDAPLRVTLLRVTDGDGDTHEVDYARGETTTELVGRPATLPSGSYRVEWRGLSDDGHAASGSFSFRIE